MDTMDTMDSLATVKNLFASALNEFVRTRLNRDAIARGVLDGAIRSGDGTVKNGDLLLLLVHPVLRELCSHRDELAEHVVRASQTWGVYVVQRFEIVEFKQGTVSVHKILLFLDRQAVFRATLGNLEPVKCNNIPSCQLAIFVSNEVPEWTRLRLSCLKSSYLKFYEYLSAKCDVVTCDIDCGQFYGHESDAFRRLAERFAPASNEKSFTIDLASLGCTFSPFFSFSKIHVDHEQITKALHMKTSLDSISGNLVFLVPSSHLVKCQRLFMLYALMENRTHLLANVTFIPVAGVRCNQTIEQYKAVLAEDLSVGEKPECADVSWLQVAENCIKFHIMSYPQPTEVDMDVLCYKESVFVLYNCARLTHLLKKFDELRIKENAVDLSHLGNDEEWSLTLKYLLSYNSFVLTTFESNTLALHRIVRYLKNLTRAFSMYYSRVKILIKPQNNTLQTIVTRIHFVRHVYKIMSDFVRILDVVEIASM